jgi:polyphenol oxidase
VSAAVNAGDVAVLVPQWPAPQAVRAAFTLRGGGVSAGPYQSLNLGAQVGDAADAVAENRRRVRASLHLPAEPAWVEQVHGVGVLDLDAPAHGPVPCADAVIARRAGNICAVQVADCLPVLFAARDAGAVAAAHAGWRGLAAGVLEATVARLGGDPAELIAWLGPAIGPAHFEVGEEVRSAFLAHDPAAAQAFAANARGRWQCDLGALARQRLSRSGVSAVFGGGWCTYADPLRFFSYRRDGQCGRMAALIWLDGSG